MAALLGDLEIKARPFLLWGHGAYHFYVEDQLSPFSFGLNKGVNTYAKHCKNIKIIQVLHEPPAVLHFAGKALLISGVPIFVCILYELYFLDKMYLIFWKS